MVGSARKETVNELWLRQQGSGKTVEEMAPKCDYMSALLRVAARFITVTSQVVSQSDGAPLLAAAAGLIVAVLTSERGLPSSWAGESRMCAFVSIVALPVLERLQVLQHTATHCNTLQHTATHCNTLQHTTTHTHIQ